MRWQGRKESDNIEDRRGIRSSRGIIGGGLGSIILILIVLFLGGNPKDIMNLLQSEQTSQSTGYQATAEEEQLANFVSVTLAETEDTWEKIFREQQKVYIKPKLVLFTDQIESACGFSSAASGPFYCPGDNKVYIDLSFAQELKEKFNAPGDFALAYVIAHEVGHHVQNLLGISDKVSSLRSRLTEEEYNKYSVRLELQADFFAGVWAHYAEKVSNILEPGDVEEAMNAASAVGDDNIQKQSQGYIVPDAFTHGTSEQRTRWFMKGFKSGDISKGDTFSSENL
jgi:uncharacterized protein